MFPWKCKTEGLIVSGVISAPVFFVSLHHVTAAFFAAAPLCDGFDFAPFSDGDHGCASHWREHSRVDRRLPAGWRRLRRWRWWPWPRSGHGGGYGGGDGGGNGGDKGGSPPDEDPEDDLSAFARRKCRRCGKVEYLRKGGCANPSCVAWLIVFQVFFPLEIYKT